MKSTLMGFFRSFSFPRVAALIFEGALIGTIGWLMTIVGQVVFPWLSPFGTVTMLVGAVTVLCGVFGYAILLINEALREKT